MVFSAGDLVSDVGSVREVGDSAGGRELLKNIECVVYDDVGAGNAEVHDSDVENATFTLMKDGAEFEEEEH